MAAEFNLSLLLIPINSICASNRIRTKAMHLNFYVNFMDKLVDPELAVMSNA